MYCEIYKSLLADLSVRFVNSIQNSYCDLHLADENIRAQRGLVTCSNTLKLIRMGWHLTLSLCLCHSLFSLHWVLWQHSINFVL